MRSNLARLALIGASIVVVISCDSALPTTPLFKSSTSTSAPTVKIDTPLTAQTFNIGDSILVTATVHDDRALKSLTFAGLKVKGSVSLGTYTQTPRYKSMLAPTAGTFRPGLTDTVVSRYLQPLSPLDTTVDSLIVRVYATDSAGVTDSASVRVNLVFGPRVVIQSPIQGDSVPAGAALPVSVRATANAGIGRLSFRVQGDTNWPTKLDTTVSQIYNTGPHDITLAGNISIPINAPAKSRITVSTIAVDANQQPATTSPVYVFVRTPSNQPPLVTDSVPSKMEIADTMFVNASGLGITFVGYQVTDTTGAFIKRDSVAIASPFPSKIVLQKVPVNLAGPQQGQRLVYMGFAYDQAGHIGYSVQSKSTQPTSTAVTAKTDTILMSFGRTYRMPAGRTAGRLADIAVDPLRGNVFVSNIQYNKLEVWQNSVKAFDTLGIAVGSQPWGMAPSTSPDTLLVANSGATTISRVYIGNSNPELDREDLAHRMRTRASYLFTVNVSRDLTTGKTQISATGPIQYSDRPQYIAQAKGGRIFYSTTPTATASPGTIRWLDPSLPVPDPRQIWQYGNVVPPGSGSINYVLFNVDSIAIGKALPSSTNSDTLFIWDHPYGQATGTIAVFDTIPTRAVTTADSLGSDAQMVAGLDIGSLALTDTTFVGISGDRSWVAFGQGNTISKAGMLMMVQDSGGPAPGFFSPRVTVQDLVNNASESINGAAIDQTGLLTAAHGSEAYFSAVDVPFHLRLDGTYASNGPGSGIAFHPGVNGMTTPSDQRVAFVGSSLGYVEIVDVAYYINRGTLPLKYGLYGPLRASLPLPGDDPSVVLKLYGMNANGLVVIDLRASDIKPGP